MLIFTIFRYWKTHASFWINCAGRINGYLWWSSVSLNFQILISGFLHKDFRKTCVVFDLKGREGGFVEGRGVVVLVWRVVGVGLAGVWNDNMVSTWKFDTGKAGSVFNETETIDLLSQLKWTWDLFMSRFPSSIISHIPFARLTIFFHGHLYDHLTICRLWFS